jgi:hypothetical protein
VRCEMWCEVMWRALLHTLQAPCVVPPACVYWWPRCRLASLQGVLLPLLGHVDGTVRVSAARLLGIAAAALPGPGVQQLLSGLVASFRIEAAAKQGDAPPPTFETQEGSLLAAGGEYCHPRGENTPAPQPVVLASVSCRF